VGPWEFAVPGNQAWISTGIQVSADVTYHITATGTICFHKGDCAGTMVGPCGLDEACFDQECQTQPYTPPYHHGALIAKIGETGRPFLICDDYNWPMPSSGVLYLGINDGYVADNDLAFQASVYPPQQ